MSTATLHPYGYGSVTTSLWAGFTRMYAHDVLPARRRPRRVTNDEPSPRHDVTIDSNHPTNNPRETDEGGYRPSCVGLDPEQFFPKSAPGVRWGYRPPATAICQYCPMKAPCLQWALDHHEQGIWGGYTEPERERMR